MFGQGPCPVQRTFRRGRRCVEGQTVMPSSSVAVPSLAVASACFGAVAVTAQAQKVMAFNRFEGVGPAGHGRRYRAAADGDCACVNATHSAGGGNAGTFFIAADHCVRPADGGRSAATIGTSRTARPSRGDGCSPATACDGSRITQACRGQCGIDASGRAARAGRRARGDGVVCAAGRRDQRRHAQRPRRPCRVARPARCDAGRTSQVECRQKRTRRGRGAMMMPKILPMVTSMTLDA